MPYRHDFRLISFIALATCVAVSCTSGDPKGGSGGTDAGTETTAEETATGTPDGSTGTDPGTTDGPEGTGGGTSTGSGTTGGDVTTGGTASTTDGGNGGDLPDPGPDTTVPLFEGAHVYFLGGDNQRVIDAEVTFPGPEGAYEEITLELTLGCPNGLCDWWDRKGYIAIVENAGTDDEQVLELIRMMTPYRVGGTWRYDITHLRPLLTGTRTVRVFIDTWVGPGHANGDGWLVDANVEMKGGLPDRLPLQVIPLWTKRDVRIGDPADPVADQLPPQTVAIGSDVTGADLVAILTGHGQGNAENCAEFCQKTHGFKVGDTPVQQLLWRDDCDQNPVDDQQGNWRYARAGWCPGAEVVPWIADVSGAIQSGTDLVVEHDMSPYENTCRPDAPECTGCALGTGCEYDGNRHTPPHVDTSVVLVTYRDL